MITHYIVDCPTQLICTWIFICWVGGGYSIQGVAKCLSPYFTQEWAFLTNFCCRLYMSTVWRRVRSQRLIHRSRKRIKKTKFSKKLFKNASLKSGIPEMCHPKSRNPEMGQLNSGIPEMCFHKLGFPEMCQLKSGSTFQESLIWAATFREFSICGSTFQEILIWGWPFLIFL